MTDWAVILPALDEEGSVTRVVSDFRKAGAGTVLVVDNGSVDETPTRATRAGATVVHESRKGYGSAVLAGIEALRPRPPAFVVFADCDGTLDASESRLLLQPLEDSTADLTLGRRRSIEKGALPTHQRWGNAAACLALRVAHGARVSDVPPFRAATWSLLERLRLREPTYGLPVETVARAARAGARIVEVDVTYRLRASGQSKVAGTLGGSLRAAWSMARTVARIRRDDS